MFLKQNIKVNVKSRLSNNMVTLHHTIVHGMVFAIRQKGLAPCRYFFRTLGDSPTSTHLCEVGLHIVLPDNLPTLPRQMETKAKYQ